MKKIAVFFIRVYQRGISPLLPPCCRFVPTCSAYAVEALERFGFWRGMVLSVRRFCRCNPFFEGGYDPVPNSWDDVKRRKKK